jgi:hypothetical protein
MRARINREAAIKTLQDTGGIVSDAAKLLGVPRATLSDLTCRDPAVKVIVDEAREELADHAQKTLARAVRRGNITASIFALKAIRQWNDRPPPPPPPTSH